MQKCRLIISAPADGAMNMATDEAILEAVGRGDSPPTLRLYKFVPATASLGYFQKLANAVDIEACRARGYDVVRRPTGGRMVLHDDELTYAVIAPDNLPGLEQTVTESYHHLSEGLKAGLEFLGVDVSFAEQKPEGEGSAACFDAPSWYELNVAGRKIVGSAQVRAHGGVLQHGSVMMDFHAEDVAFACGGTPERQARLANVLRRRALGIKEALGREVRFDDVAGALRRGFETALGVKFVRGTLTRTEARRALELRETKYARPEFLTRV
jgi:lipoate-protein ligase A